MKDRSSEDIKPYTNTQQILARTVEIKTNEIKAMQETKNQEELRAKEATVAGLVYQYEINEIIIRQLENSIQRMEEREQDKRHAEEQEEFWQQYQERENNIAKVDDRDPRSIADALKDLETNKEQLKQQIFMLEGRIVNFEAKIQEVDNKIKEIDKKINDWFGPEPGKPYDPNEWARLHGNDIARVMNNIYEKSGSDPAVLKEMQKSLMESDLDPRIKQKAMMLSTLYNALTDCMKEDKEEKRKACQEKLQGFPPEEQKGLMAVAELSIERQNLEKTKNQCSKELESAKKNLEAARIRHDQLEEQGKSLNIRLKESEEHRSSGPKPPGH